MTQLLALVLLFVAATAFNINEGVALTPSMVLYLLFFATAAGVVVIAVDPGDPTSCTGRRATRRSRSPTARRSCSGCSTPRRCSSPRWSRWSPARTSRAPTRPAPSLTMTFVVMGLGTVFNALTNRRDPASGLRAADPQGARDLALSRSR